MNFGEWNAQLHENFGMMGADLWLRRNNGKDWQVLNHKGEIKTIVEGTIPDNDDYFVRFESIEQLQAISEAFANYGVRTINDHKALGLLEAKDAHLEDMRTITFDLLAKLTDKGDKSDAR